MKSSSVFRFLSSVKLAVPLMLAMTITVAYGTVVESRFSTDVARLTVYHTLWFEALLVLLWINIFCATLSRWPFRLHHVGFIITHIGLLTLLIGAFVTNVWGIDGQLQVAERTQSNEVALPELALEVIHRERNTKEVFPVDRRLHEAGYDDFKAINERIADRVTVVGYLPFAKAERVFHAAPQDAGGLENVSVSFRLKSAFFDVKEWLHSSQNPEFQLGPAHLSLVLHGKDEAPRAPQATAPKKERPKPIARKAGVLQVLKKGSEVVLEEIPFSRLEMGPVEVGQVVVVLSGTYQQAMVAGKGKITEGGKKGANPAIEITVMGQGKKEREVLFSKFPTFTLHNEGVFGLTFRFLGPDSPADSMAGGSGGSMPDDSVHAELKGREPVAPSAGGNVVQFHVYVGSRDKSLVKLLKNGQEVLSRWVKKGETIQTPWMGMELTLVDLVANGSETTEVRAVPLTERAEMPPSALRIRPAGSAPGETLWLLEGDARDITVRGEPYQVYYGRRTFALPFRIFLEKFTKADYPGTQTAMSFESLVRVDDGPTPIRIYMNEPLVRAGYTLYQASYVLRPGAPAVSVLSVNWDPGRWVKYIGSLILVTGIATFTLMRSRIAKAKRGMK